MHIPQGIDVEAWAALANQTSECKSRLGMAGKPVVLYPGHFSSGYGVWTLLRALPRVLARMPNLKVILACRQRSDQDRQQERAVRQEIDETGLADSVRFFNTVGDIRPLIGASDVVLLPFETLRDKVDIPTTLLESLAARKPIIISDIPPMNELMDGYGAGRQRGIGLTVPPRDEAALVDAMLTLLQADVLRAEMGQRGQDLVQERFDIRRVAGQYERLYREMLS
jgi:glycosyltransferase involved in cell wall biosynthesis